MQAVADRSTCTPSNHTFSTSGISPGFSAEASDRVSTPEREHRKALEYGEDDEPGGVELEAKEVALELPNIPMPRSSDGNVSGFPSQVDEILSR